MDSQHIFLIFNFRYVEWSLHEPEPGIYTFEGNNNLPKFLQTAQDLDMLVILRPGPFIDAERDMVGIDYIIRFFFFSSFYFT